MSKRRIECEFEFDIDADVDSVWDALTQAEHISNWFAPYVQAEPGKGGYISLAWADPNQPMRLDITNWDPGRHLETTWHAAPAGEQSILLPLDISVESTGDGTTRLKLVHSGFLSDESWDDEFESHSRGWNTELRHLKYYLEEKFSKTRQFVFKKLSLPDAGFSVREILDPGAEAKEGDQFEVRLVDGNIWRCRLLYQLATSDLVFICDALDGGVVRLAIETMSGSPELWFWAFSWSMREDQIAEKILPLLDQAQK